MNSTGKRIIQKVLAILVILVMTMADFSLVGVNLVSYAIDQIETNNENVGFNVYFADQNQTLETTAATTANDLQLVIELSVKKDGYLSNGKIELEEGSNFVFKKGTTDSHIKNIESRAIELNQINEGDNIKIQVPIGFAVSEEIDLDYLSKATAVNLTGKYINSDNVETNEGIDIEGRAEAKVNWKSPENTKSELVAKLLTNSIYNVEGEDKRIVQLLITSKLTNNSYPVKNTNIELTLSDVVKNVTVHKRTTKATNGDRDFNHEYKDGKLTIIAENGADNKISWKKNAEDSFVVTMEYPEVPQNIIPVTAKITTYDDKTLTQNAEVQVTDQKQGIVSVSQTQKEYQIGKGKLYSGEKRAYKTTSNLYVDYAKAVEAIALNEKQPVFVAGEEEKAANIEYVQTTIDRNQFIELFGEEGTLKIQDQDGNQVANINKETSVDENGKIVVKYASGTTSITIITSKPQKEGILNLEHQKNILNSDYSREDIKTFTQIKGSNEVTYNIGSEKTEKNTSSSAVTLKETESKASLSVDPVTLSTSQNGQDLNIKVVLETNNENRDLYKNPEITLQLPNQINSIAAEGELFYGNGLAIDSFKVNAKDATITAKLKGEQKSYEGDAVKGATLLIRANVKLNKLSTNSTEQIVLNYTNENATKYSDNQQEKVNVNVVSENSIILTNDITEYNITTLGNEGTKEINLQNNAEAKKATVKMKVVNNEEADISNVGILGKIANEPGKIDRTSAIRTGAEATIYYTNKENPTTQLSKAENGWTTENIQDAKFYLIIIKNIKNAEAVDFRYDIQVAKNLPYNVVAETGYKMAYTNSLTGNDKQAQSTIIALSSGKVAEIKTGIKAEVAGEAIKAGDEVKAGEIINYTATVSNAGREKAENVTVTATIPENTTLITINPEYGNDEQMGGEGEEQKYITEKTEKELKRENLTIEAGKNVTFTYAVRVNTDLTQDAEGESKVSVKYGQDETTSSIKNNFVKSALVATLIPRFKTELANLTAGYTYTYITEISNPTDKEQKNVRVNINKNNLISISNISYTLGDDYITLDNGENEFIIDSIPSKGKITIMINALIESPRANVNTADMSINVKDESGKAYKSNEISKAVDGVKVEVSLKSSTTSDVENGYLKPGDEIKYTVKVKNVSNIDADNLVIEDDFSDYLELQKVKLDGKEKEYEVDAKISASSESLNNGEEEEIVENTNSQENENYDTIRVQTNLKAGKETTLEIEGKVDEELSTRQILKVANQAYVYNNVLLAETNENVAYIESLPTLDTTEPEDSTTPNETPNITSKYIISGTVWEDNDQNGSRDSGEKKFEGIKVYAIDVTNNKIATDSEGKEISATTNSEGFYTLTNMPKGKYIVAFEYNTEKYMTTVYQAKGVSADKNSDAVKGTRTINEEEKVLALTDSIDLTSSLANIDLGLAESKVFDLQLEKVISKMIVTNTSGTKTYEFDDQNLTKIEIAGKDLSNSNVVIEYKIKVTNKGEIAGYAKSIVDYVPSSLTFNSGLNNDWYQKGENLYTSSLANTLIEPGETKEVKLILTKKMTESNTGLTNNKAAIENSYNTLGVTNTSSTSKGDNENRKDTGSADTIIGVKTGAAVSYVALTLTVVIIIAAAAYLVNKKILIEKIKI